MNAKVMAIYEALLKHYGPQGWWPVAGSYHPGDYGVPKNEEEAFEIIAGAVLTQNTAWTSVERALENLRRIEALNPCKILALSLDVLKSAIRPAGFFNQKAIYLREIALLFAGLKGRTPSRKELMSVKGVGNETADSILLYAYKRPEFVIDAYTKRIATALGLAERGAGYIELKDLFESNLPRDVAIYQEYHALLVEHAKRFYSGKA
ncbi:MAG TPA: endonuclease III domain-containing protein, partial [Acetomicrobium flavidum]|uniref:endonuclease III domain-containing protein n=1 Tax=Acetomicrobium flavidum TaxID=49896 RepID=UPI002C2DB87E|nr:endonuclease III domain-containing protein [Acetomicrobium flavidum]